MVAIPFDSQDAWHRLRAAHIGGSEVAALFGESPYTTRWQLWHQKRGTLAAPDLSSNVAVTGGRHMEPALAGWAAEKWGMAVRKVKVYLEDDTEPGLGASLDFETEGGEPVEIKFSLWGDGWDWERDTITDYPLSYGLQVQAQLAVTGAARGWLVAFCGGDLRRCQIQRSEAIVEALRREVGLFWLGVRQGIEPSPDFEKDAAAIDRLYAVAEDRIINLSDDATAAELCVRFLDACRRENIAKSEHDAARAELLVKLGTAKGATIGDFRVLAPAIPGSLGTLITPEMVDTYIGGRAGYRRLTLKREQKKGT